MLLYFHEQVWQLQEPLCNDYYTLNFTLNAEDFYGSSASSWKLSRWVRLHLIFTMRININSNLESLTKFSSIRRKFEFKDILSWSISQVISKIIPICTRTVISYTIKRGIPFWICRKVNGKKVKDSRETQKFTFKWNCNTGIQELSQPPISILKILYSAANSFSKNITPLSFPGQDKKMTNEYNVNHQRSPHPLVLQN